jgi:RNA polymerase primary sigma factor
MAEKTDAVSQYFRNINTLTCETPRKEMFELWKLAKAGNRKAKQRILECNLRLVVPIARRYYRAGMDLMDLIEEGNLGLLRSIDKFEPKKGYRFSTYATYCIEQYIRKASEEKGSTIKIPSHAWEVLRKWLKQWDKFRGELGRDPTLSEMAHKMNWSARQIKSVVEASEIMKSTGSLHSPVGMGSSDVTVGDTLVDTQVFTEISVKEGFKQAFQQIGTREKNILQLRYGLAGKSPLTLHQVGKKLKLSRERVRQIEERALMRFKRVCYKMGIIELNHFLPSEVDTRPEKIIKKIKTNILGQPIGRKKIKKTKPKKKSKLKKRKIKI